MMTQTHMQLMGFPRSPVCICVTTGTMLNLKVGGNPNVASEQPFAHSVSLLLTDRK